MEDAMQTHTRRAVLTGLAALLVSGRPGVTQSPPLKIVYPFSAGGAADGIARLIADELQQRLGRPVLVENVVGAGGRIAARAVKDGPANGTVLLFASSSQTTLQPHIYRDLGYQPFDDFMPISQIVRSELAFAVSGQIPVRSINELIAWLKADPAQALYGSPGIGTGPHFAGIEFGRMLGLELRHVPYRGTPAALPDVLAGRIPFYIALAAELIEQHKSGGLRILATAGATRSPFLPEVPTLTESGIAILAPGWFAFYAPRRTPEDIRAVLEREIIAATRAPDVHSRMLAMGFEPTGTTSAQLSRLQREEFERWGSIVKTSGFHTEK
jgi:tripartite-type tricarboxylate transporter receptor subunit TctC